MNSIIQGLKMYRVFQIMYLKGNDFGSANTWEYIGVTEEASISRMEQFFTPRRL